MSVHARRGRSTHPGASWAARAGPRRGIPRARSPGARKNGAFGGVAARAGRARLADCAASWPGLAKVQTLPRARAPPCLHHARACVLGQSVQIPHLPKPVLSAESDTWTRRQLWKPTCGLTEVPVPAASAVLFAEESTSEYRSPIAAARCA